MLFIGKWENIMDTIGKRLKYVREELHMAQNTVAEALGITVQCYGCYERDEYKPSYKVLKSICEDLKWDISFILCGDHKSESELNYLYDQCAGQNKQLFGETASYLIDLLNNQNKTQKNITYCLYKYRMEHQYTNSTMAKILGVTDNRYSRIENGTVMPDADFLQKIREKLYIDPAYLLTGVRSSCDTLNEKLEQLEEKDQKKIIDIMTGFVKSE